MDLDSPQKARRVDQASRYAVALSGGTAITRVGVRLALVHVRGGWVPESGSSWSHLSLSLIESRRTGVGCEERDAPRGRAFSAGSYVEAEAEAGVRQGGTAGPSRCGQLLGWWWPARDLLCFGQIDTRTGLWESVSWGGCNERAEVSQGRCDSATRGTQDDR